jgi:hypothetical protein
MYQLRLKMLVHPPFALEARINYPARLILRVQGGPDTVVVEKFPALLIFSHLYSKSCRNARTDRPVPTSTPDHWSVLVDQSGHFYNLCYINVKISKVLGTFLLQPCGAPWTLRMSPAG